jgi:hypothetical protein
MTAKFDSFSIPDPREESQQASDTLRELKPELLQNDSTPDGLKRAIAQVALPLLFLKNLLFANADEFHGQNLVTDELVDHSRLTARVVSIGSLLNSITNQPILFFAFKDFGNVFAIGASLVLNLLIIKFTNDNGTAVAGRKSGNRAWARTGAAAILAMSLLQSVAAGVGSEALNNRPQLARLKALELIERQSRNLEDMPVTSIEVERARQDYEATLREYQNTPKDDPKWDALYVKLFGRWVERHRDWSQVSPENLPLEQRVLRLEKQAAKPKREARQAWAQKLARRQQIGDDVLFLEQEMPQLFARHFNENYELHSGTETIRLAAINLYNKLMHFDLAGLGFPLFFLILSMATSGAACWLVLAHARREDTEMSRNDAVGEAVSAYLDDLIRAASDEIPSSK